jgi:hypothetical protein
MAHEQHTLKILNFVNDPIIFSYIICHLNDELEIINVNTIEKKCIILEHEEEFFISIANFLNEHDHFYSFNIRFMIFLNFLEMYISFNFKQSLKTK